MTTFDDAMGTVEDMVELRCRVDADLRHRWRPENTWHLRPDGPEPDVTAEHAIYLVESWKNCGPAVHFTAGMMVRNWYGLWRKDCPLTKPADGHWLAPDADDISARIIDRVRKALAEGS